MKSQINRVLADGDFKAKEEDYYVAYRWRRWQDYSRWTREI